MISYFSWSRGYDSGDFMIYFPKTHDPVISLTEIPWCADLWIEGRGGGAILVGLFGIIKHTVHSSYKWLDGSPCQT